MSKAIFYFDKEISLYPNNSKTYYMKGLALGYSKREQEAIESFKIYVEKNPTTWAGRNDLAWLQFRVGDIDGALATIEVIAKKDPNNPWIANTYGVLLYNKQRYREAKEVLTLGLLTLNNYTSEDWGKAYPGNNPIVYSQGLLAMKNSFRENIALVNKALVK
jgi:tetratricopeptide (TPR) repeat protein